MSYEVWGDNDDDTTTASHLLENGWWDEDTVERVTAAVRALWQEQVYQNGSMTEGVSVRFIMRLNILAAEVGLLSEEEPIVVEARAALPSVKEGE